MSQETRGAAGTRSSSSRAEKPKAKGGKPNLDRGLQDHIGHKLRTIYDEVVKEPVPDQFLDLLNKLEKSEKMQAPEGAEQRSEVKR